MLKLDLGLVERLADSLGVGQEGLSTWLPLAEDRRNLNRSDQETLERLDRLSIEIESEILHLEARFKQLVASNRR